MMVVAAGPRTWAAIGPEGLRRLEERDRLGVEGNRFHAEGELAEAVAAFERAWTIESEVFGAGRQSEIDTLVRLVRLQAERDDLPKARPRLVDAIDAVTRARGPGHWQVADARRELADIDTVASWGPERRDRFRRSGRLVATIVGLMRERKYAEALKVADELQAIRKELWGEEHPEFAKSLFSHGMLFSRLGDLPRAKQLLDRALQSYRTSIGPEHPYSSACLDQLATVALAEGDAATAVRLRREVLRLAWTLYGEETIPYANAAYRLAESCESAREDAEASLFFRLAGNVYSKVGGKERREYFSCRLKLGTVYYREEDYARAEPALREALSLAGALLIEEERDVAVTLAYLGLVLKAKDDFPNAADLLGRARDAFEKIAGPDDDSTIACTRSLGEVYQRMGDSKRSEPLLFEAKALARKKHEKQAKGHGPKDRDGEDRDGGTKSPEK
jgi:tetratricopeptide (TPR) repeat protein